MAAEQNLWFRRPSGEVFSIACHPELTKSYMKHYTDKGFELLLGEPGAVAIKGDLAPEPEPKAEAEAPEPKQEKRGPGRPRT
jgi:hypothetical protein